MRNNLFNLMGMVLYLTIMKLKIFFTLFTLYLILTRSKKMWNQMVINYHLYTLFEIIYIHLLDGINQVSILVHVKDKNMLLCQ